MQRPEIFIIIFFLIYFFFPIRNWVVKKGEIFAVIIFAFLLPIMIEPVWDYNHSQWTLFIFGVPVFFTLYWIALVFFSINISDSFLKISSKRFTGIKSHWLNLLTDIISFCLIGTVCECILYGLKSYNYIKGTELGFIPILNVPVILPLGYVGIGVFAAHTFRIKRKEKII